MKTVVSIFTLLCYLSTAFGLICFSCEFGASSMRECSRKGYFKKCRTENHVCATVVRRQYARMSVYKTCKEKYACTVTMIEQNYAPDGASIQCNKDSPVSKCSCCCAEDRCNFESFECNVETKSIFTNSKKNERNKYRNKEKKRKNIFYLKKTTKNKKKVINKQYKSISDKNKKTIHTAVKRKHLYFKKKRITNKKSNIKYQNKTVPITTDKEKEVHDKMKSVANMTDKEESPAEENLSRLFNPPSCASMTPMENGDMTCSNGNKPGSVCEFRCQDPQFIMMPQENKRLICNETKKWNMEKPTCRPTCPPLKEEPHGNLECSRDIREVGSHCVVKCNASKYVLEPKDHGKLSCLPSMKWDKPQGCCALKCPPYIIADILVIMHASTNKSYEIFHEIINVGYKRLVKSDKNGFLIAMIEFSGELHPQNFFQFSYTMQHKSSTLTQSHLHFNTVLLSVNDFTHYVPLNKKLFLNAPFEPTPDDRCNIGRVLSWSFRRLRGYGSGNREHVPDFVIIATDSRSTDPVESVAKKWRDTGALLYVLTQKGRNGVHPSRKDLMKITADSSRIFRYNYDVGKVADKILKAQMDHFCPNLC